MLKMLGNMKKFHFVGIGGAGMSPLAKILLELGYEISGSDRSASHLTDELGKMGAKIYVGQAAEQVRGADAIVVSTAIPYDNPEVLAAGQLGIPKLHRSDINAALVNEYKGIAVAGAHGKTTTTAMLAVALSNIGVSPSFVIGGEAPDLGTNSRLGTSEFLVSEADESDGSFLKLKPYIAVVTNVENDHMDHYGTMDNIRAAFRDFIGNVREDGAAVVCFDNENLRRIAPQIATKIVTYAIDHEADYRAVNIRPTGTGTIFDVVHDGKTLGQVELNIPGRHNVLDALAAIVTGTLLGIDVPKMAAGLKTFHGAKRRFQTKGRVNGVWIVDDYGHHPSEIAATLAAARQTNPSRLVCVFQPHRYSRTKLLAAEFGRAFVNADLIVLTDIYSAGEEPIVGISGKTIAEEIDKQTGQVVEYVADKTKLASYLKEIVQPGDLVITMGAGDIYRVGEELVGLL